MPLPGDVRPVASTSSLDRVRRALRRPNSCLQQPSIRQYNVNAKMSCSMRIVHSMAGKIVLEINIVLPISALFDMLIAARDWH